MLSLEEASKIVLSSARQLDSERVDMAMTVGRILAEDITSDIDVPPFIRSAMDGYACRRADLANELLVIETIRAGCTPSEIVGPNQCSKIMTGAMVPQGADCVVMVEQTEMKAASAVRFTGNQTRDNIRPRGEDIRAGKVILRRGIRIRPQHIAVLATVGCTRPLVSERPKVGIISTGDELVRPAKNPKCSQIRESNSHQLSAQIGQIGGIASSYGIVPDHQQDIDRALREAIAENDVVVLSGGVSAGDCDFVPDVMTQIGIDVLFRKIAVKPGKPTVFGVWDDVYCFGLPGNPVASFVVFELLVKPFLYGLMGHNYRPPRACAPLATKVGRRKTDRQSWIPVVITEDLTAEPLEYHGSADIRALADADGLISLDTGIAEVEKGTVVCITLI
ncbi:MAG: molybdopterin molybdotransferase MoeA [Phycisphaerales bacterium]|nr:MAG: molybdopterin molybdotransferase MoeA [Phycisphaerales bacterium]